MTARLEPFNLPAGPGRSGSRLCIHHSPRGTPAQGALVYLHPFAEEMNKSRRMAALCSRRLADAGWAVLQVDLYGCGDSDGDFGDATWDDWVQDAIVAAQWLRERHGLPAGFWGLRTGCLIAADAARRLDWPANLLLWQPVIHGRATVQHLLRLGAASGGLAGDAQSIIGGVRARWASGDTVEIAGYRLSAALAVGLETASLVAPPPTARVAWLEVSSRPEPALLPASAATVETWRGAGVQVRASVCAGPAFWQTTEIEVAPELLTATVDALRDCP